jgi:predicted transcriptional regulator
VKERRDLPWRADRFDRLALQMADSIEATARSRPNGFPIGSRGDAREAGMTASEQYVRIRRSLEDKLGVEEATYLMDRPPGGWSDLVTNHTLGLQVAVLQERFATIDRRFEEIDRRFEEIDRRFEEIDRRFEEIDRRFEEIDRRFDALEIRIDTAVASLRHELLAEIERRFRALTIALFSAIIAGMAMLGAITRL